MRTGLKILHIICFLLLLGSGDFQVRGLTVTEKDGPTEALRGENVTIPCLLSGVPIPLNLQILSVVWSHRLQNGTEYKVYQFQGSHHQSWRNRSHMNDRDLQQGNASLSISNIQITDEGEYRCFVIATPDSGTATSILHVSVKPQTSMRYKRLIQVGFPGSVFCNVSNFYPQEVKIRWVKHSKGIITSSSLDEDVSLTKQIRNSDGTFNVVSDLTVRPDSRDEPGDVFFCIVSHRSLKKDIFLNFTMPKWSPVMEILIALGLLMILVLVTLILDKCVKKGWRPWIRVFLSALFISTTLLVCFLIYFMVEFGDLPTWLYIVLPCLSTVFLLCLAYYGRFLWKYFTRGNLTVSRISGNYYMTHMKRTTLTCQITDFRQKEIQINVPYI
ncbi:natural cytotoxicity triggering receptor 3 ligand 1-like [Aquarana catesbeiana]|uniref:natural cytotoxicity triggering receptor 3 ligand 1-like n=1 Tax=Aquarana catesbeiana TaxID=8400 RepID=UPI003CC99981